MKAKRILIKILIIIMLLIIIVLSILLAQYSSAYKTIYEDLKEPKFGYYLNRELEITSIDLMNHNSIYEILFLGEHNYYETIDLLTYLNYVNKCNFDNEYLLVKTIFNNKEYLLGNDEEFEYLSNQIKTKYNYFININYNESSGFVNSIIINKI